MKKARYLVDKDYEIGVIDKRLYGSFIEHMRRVVYNGIYEPDHPNSDEDGFRKDVIDLVREAGITMVRYPGGNFVSGYDWKDGIGPKEQRKSRPNLAWNSIETNQVGIDEFSRWADKAGVTVAPAVNLGTGTIRDAAEFIEYCNFKSGTYYSDLRRKNGREAPYDFRLWCIGNEMDGKWQIGSLSAEDYAKKALEAAKLMKLIDPSIELVACGSCCTEIDSYPEWNSVVLQKVYDAIDYISLHRYYTYDTDHHLFYPVTEDKSDIAYFPVDLNNFIHTVVCAADFAKTKVNGSKDIHISFDEWNVVSDSNPAFVDIPSWQPAIEEGQEVFNLRDALIVGGLMCTFLKNADRVKIACQSLLINAGGLIYTIKGGKAIKNTVFYPFSQVAKYGKGISLMDKVESPQIETNHHGPAPAIQTATAYDPVTGELTVFVVNFSNEDILFSMDFRSFGQISEISHTVLEGKDLDAINSPASPDNVVPHEMKVEKEPFLKTEKSISGMSWNVFRYKSKANN